jgi:hypothetical protein
MDTEDRLDALEAKARKNSIIIGMIVVLVLWISFDLKLHTVALKLIGLEINDMEGLKSAKKTSKSKSGFDAYLIKPSVKDHPPHGLVKDHNNDILVDTTMGF